MATLKEEEEVEFHGDVLETILSHVPLVDLVAARHVSKTWHDAVSSSLRHLNPPKPWLILHAQSTRLPRAASARAYDPRSGLWIAMSHQPTSIGDQHHHASAIASSPSNFLYALSPSKFSFSLDPLGSDWRSADPPRVWRTDPIVARVGDSVVVAGGACDFEDDPLAVEVYGLRTRAWRACESMPGNLKGCSWVSAAATAEKLVVADKQSGVTHWFDPETGSWSGPVVINPGQPVSSYHIGCSGNSLLLIGVCRVENVDGVKIWRFDENDFSASEEIGEMPEEFVTRLKRESFGDLSVDVRVAGNVVYVYSAGAEVVACEVVPDGDCRWWGVGNVVAREEMIEKRFAFTCSKIGVEDLERAMLVNNLRFGVASSVR